MILIGSKSNLYFKTNSLTQVMMESFFLPFGETTSVIN